MEDKVITEFNNRRKFLRNTALGAVGATLLGALPSSQAVAMPSKPDLDRDISLRHQAEQEEAENFCRSLFLAMDDLDVEGFLGFFSDENYQQDIILGDFSDLLGGTFAHCSLYPKSEFRSVVSALFARIGRPGRLMKFIHSTGSIKYGVAVDLHTMPNSFFMGGVDLVSYIDIRDGKIVRRNDYYDTAELTPADIAFVHPGGVPRQSCLAGPLPGDIGHASSEMWNFTHALHGALSSGHVGRVLQFFDEDALLIHPLLYRGSGGYGPFNRGIQIRGRKAIARFFQAVLPLLPDGKDSSLIHLIGGATGGGYEWKSGGIYSQQGIARNGIPGVTAIDLYGDRVQRMSVKFDTLQMLPEQRDAVRRALADECLVVP